MTDKELLFYAANAHGNLIYIEDLGWIHQDKNGNRGSWWNPLDDSRDAFDLFVKLKLDVSFGDDYYFDKGPMTFCGSQWDCRESAHFKRFVKHAPDPYAATRLAIVREAAEIGKTKHAN